MKEGLLHEIELKPHKMPTMHPFPHPHGRPTTSTMLGVGWTKGGGIPVQVGLQISHPKKIQFKSNSKLVQNKFERLSIPNSLKLLY